MTQKLRHKVRLTENTRASMSPVINKHVVIRLYDFEQLRSDEKTLPLFTLYNAFFMSKIKRMTNVAAKPDFLKRL